MRSASGAIEHLDPDGPQPAAPVPLGLFWKSWKPARKGTMLDTEAAEHMTKALA